MFLKVIAFLLKDGLNTILKDLPTHEESALLASPLKPLGLFRKDPRKKLEERIKIKDELSIPVLKAIAQGYCLLHKKEKYTVIKEHWGEIKKHITDVLYIAQLVDLAMRSKDSDALMYVRDLCYIILAIETDQELRDLAGASKERIDAFNKGQKV